MRVWKGYRNSTERARCECPHLRKEDGAGVKVIVAVQTRAVVNEIEIDGARISPGAAQEDSSRLKPPR